MATTAYDVATSAAAASALLRSMAELIVDDDTAAIVIDTETTLLDALDKATERIAELEANAEALKARIAALRDRQSRFDRSAETLRKSVQSALESVGLRKLELPHATVSLRTTPAIVVIVDEAMLPPAYMKAPPPVPNKTALRDALKVGVIVPGAMLSNGGQTLSINSR